MERFEKLADEFEDEWFVGNGPRIEDFLGRVDQADRQELLKRLVRIEVEYRLKSDVTIETINFDRLGPEAVEIAQKYLDEFGEGLPVGVSPRSRRDFVGPYRLIEQIGEGGMGAVFLADQEAPVRRQVALKIIKSGLGGKQVLARFEAERQALAMMDHPNIARILDAGTTDNGDPFFAMELVQGTPLTTYCDQNKLTVDARLKIFKQVCEGVQHAHQKGIIHRDLKPSNVMVAEYDGQPVPKVIDFGLAKALETDQRLTDRTVFTEFGQVLGTLKYMSPEQAGIDSLDVDTRSDVYALGVILFELLTGRTPLDSDSFKGMALLKILELVRELDSPRPSSQLDTTKKEAVEIISSQRKLSPAKLRQVLAGDLDWIVMKALEKDRNRRYDAVSSLAEDVKCFLQGDSVEARPPTIGYQLSKFVRKNRAAVAAGVLVVSVIVAGIAGTTVYALKAHNSAKRSEDVLQVVTDAFQSVNPSHGATAKMTAKDVLLQALESLEDSDLDDEGRALLLSKLTLCFLAIGEPEAATSAGRGALKAQAGADDSNAETISSMSNLASSHLAGGRVDEAIELFEETLRKAKAEFGEGHRRVHDVSSGLAQAYVHAGRFEEAIRLYEALVEFRTEQLGPGHADTILGLGGLSYAYQMAGRLQDALPLLEQAVEQSKKTYGEDHPHTLSAIGSLAFTFNGIGDAKKALELYEGVLPLMKVKLGENHPDTLTLLNNLASSYGAVGRVSDSLRLFEESARLTDAKLGPEHPSTLNSQNNLAAAYDGAGQTREAIGLFESTLEICKRKFGDDHPITLTTSNNLASAYNSDGQFGKANAIYQQTFEFSKASLGEEHPHTIFSMSNLAGSYERMGKHKDALEMYERCLELGNSVLGKNHPDIIKILGNLADAYEVAGRVDEALEIYRQVLASQRESLGDDHQDTINSMGNLGVALFSADQLDESVVLLEETKQRSLAKFGPEHPATLRVFNNLAFVYQASKRINDALDLLEQCTPIRERKYPGFWKTYDSNLQYGDILLRLGRLDEAKERLSTGYNGLKRVVNEAPQSSWRAGMTRGLKSLVRLAELEEDAQSITKWSAELETLGEGESADN